MTRSEATGYAALLLAAGVTAALVVLSIAAGIAEAHTPGRISSEVSTLLATSLGAAIGAVATYLGGQRHHGAPDAPPEDPAP